MVYVRYILYIVIWQVYAWYITGIYLIYIPLIYSFSGFRGQHHSRPDPVPQKIPDVLPDPDDLADFELPDQQALIDAFLDGLCKESDHEFRGLSHLLASLPDPSLSQGQVEAVPVTVARERGVIPEASQCTTCWCPKARLSDPDAVFPFRNTEEVREKVAAERRRLLHRDGTPRDRCKAEVCYIFCKYVLY